MPALKPGWVVIAAPKSSVRSGELAVVVLHSGKLMVKEARFASHGLILLISHNPIYAPVVTRRRDIKFLHKVALIVPK